METNDIIAEGLKRVATLNKFKGDTDTSKWLSNKRKFSQYLLLGFTTHLKGATRKDMYDAPYIGKQLVAEFFKTVPKSIFGYRVGVTNDITGASVYITFTSLGIPIGQMKIDYVDYGSRVDINFIFMKVVDMKEFRKQHSGRISVAKKDNKRRWESQANRFRESYKSDLTKPCI